MRPGDLLQIYEALSLTSIGDIRVKGSVPKILSQSKRVIYNVYYDVNIGEIVDQLKGQKVIEAMCLLYGREKEITTSVRADIYNPLSCQKSQNVLSIIPGAAIVNCQQFRHISS